MSTLATLKREARAAATWRGHELSRFHTFTPEARIARAHCVNCPCSVDVNARPKPNEIDIGGDAVAINCAPEKWTRVDPHYSGSMARYASYPGFTFTLV